MTGNRSYLTDYKEIDGGFVAFDDFKLTNESYVLLKVHRKDNMYNVDLKNVVPQGGIEIENLIDLKVKMIRYDNRTKFKNRVMNQLCEMNGIKREFSIARWNWYNKKGTNKTKPKRPQRTGLGMEKETVKDKANQKRKSQSK
ncbi:putative ribonuclease H-like domain-containing protein [Tanacetum coccineum]